MTREGLVTGSDDATVQLWDAASGTCRQVDRHDEYVWSLAVLEEETLVTGSAAELHVLDRAR
jgi:WD40 repeat protein